MLYEKTVTKHETIKHLTTNTYFTVYNMYFLVCKHPFPFALLCYVYSYMYSCSSLPGIKIPHMCSPYNDKALLYAQIMTFFSLLETCRYRPPYPELHYYILARVFHTIKIICLPKFLSN